MHPETHPPRPSEPLPLASCAGALLLWAVLAGASAPAEDAPDTGRAAPRPRAEAPADAVLVESVGASHSAPLDPLRWSIDRSSGPARVSIGARSYALDDLLFVKFPRAPSAPGPVQVILTGGDVLSGSVAGGGEERLLLSHPGLGAVPVDVSIEWIRSLIVPGGFLDGSHRAREIDARRKLSLTSDRLLLRTQVDAIEGIVESIDARGVSFSSDQLGEVLYPFDKIRAVHFAELGAEGGEGPPRAGQGAGEVTAAVHLTDGSRLCGRIEKLAEDSLGIRHERLGELSIAPASILQVSFRGGRCQFLSDLEPARVHEHRGVLFGDPDAKKDRDAPYYSYKRDRNVLGEPLVLAGKAHAKGLGVHSYSRIEYDLGGEFQRFQAIVGLDDSARPAPDAPAASASGSVVFRVWLDGRKLQEIPLTYRDEPRSIDISIAGGNTLGLEVDFGKNDFFMARDRADWAQARVVK
ncbi:MAG: NPCBM/NEW2 domain-containing protein [Planctomycetes bacterium]|nr:NPCBM/NEW2 domain-containing protein [Planctomycetota bacterium]